jgi:hypothetical protein
MDRPPQSTVEHAPVARDLPSHGFVTTKPVAGSAIAADYTFVLTRDEIYVPIAVRRPKGRVLFPSSRSGAATAAAACLTSKRRSSAMRPCRRSCSGAATRSRT